MKKPLLQSAILTGTLIFLAASCKKTDDAWPDPHAARIVGSWRESFRAADSNGNGQADSTERITTAYYRLLTFNADGTVRDTLFRNGLATTIDASYSVNGGYLQIVFPDIAPDRILQLDDSVLLLADTSLHPAMITGFIRQ